MARGDVLQIVVFSMLFAVGLSMLGERGRPIVHWCEVLAETMFKVTHIIMLYAPIGVGAAIAYTIGRSGLGRAVEPRLSGVHPVRRAGGLRAPGAHSGHAAVPHSRSAASRGR